MTKSETNVYQMMGINVDLLYSIFFSMDGEHYCKTSLYVGGCI